MKSFNEQSFKRVAAYDRCNSPARTGFTIGCFSLARDYAMISG
jgi:hypothetical protein